MSTLTRHRRVRHLRLRAGSHEAARHAAVLLEDALRIASWPGAETSRLLLIRRLDLGTVPSQGGPATLALQLERRCREIPTELYSNPSVLNPAANMIAFASRGAALTQLAQRLARGQSTWDWYWPLVLPGWRANAPRTDAWRSLLRAAMDEEGAPMVAAEVVYAAFQGRRGSELAAGMKDSDLSGVHTALGWIVATGESSSPSAIRDSTLDSLETGASPRLTIMAEEVLRLIDQELRGNPLRVALRAWIGALLMLRHQPSLAAVRHLPQYVLEAARRRPSELQPDVSPVRRSPPSPTIANDAKRDASPLADAVLELQAFPDRRTPEIGPEAKSERQRTTGPDSQTTTNVPAVKPQWPEDGPTVFQGAELTQATQFGGLLFLVLALQRLEFSRWLEDHPLQVQEDFPTRLLLHLGTRVGLTEADPLHAALANLHPPLSPEIEAMIAQTARSWIYRLRRWCRTKAGLGLATLIRRPARLAATKTHLELFFQLSQVDLRIRRAGLDLDPGWVPWLGRVIHFHYRTSEEYDR